MDKLDRGPIYMLQSCDVAKMHNHLSAGPYGCVGVTARSGPTRKGGIARARERRGLLRRYDLKDGEQREYGARANILVLETGYSLSVKFRKTRAAFGYSPRNVCVPRFQPS